MRGYSALIALPRVRWLLLAGFLNRVSYGVETLATLYYLSGTTDSFAVAGAVSGAVVVGIAIGTVAQARLLDQRGHVLLVPLGLAHVAMIALLIHAGDERWTTIVLLAVGLTVGLTLPPVSSLVRGLYPALLIERPQLMPVAFSLDAALADAGYVAGPAMVALLLVVSDATTALLLAAAATVAGIALVLVAAPAMATSAGPASIRGLGALQAPGVLTLALASFPLGVAFGCVEVAIPAFATERGQPALGAMLLAIVALISAGGALAYGSHAPDARSWGAQAMVTRLAWCYAPATALVAVTTSPWLITVLLVPLGLVNGAWMAARNYLTSAQALPGKITEAYAWVLTSLFAGGAIGILASGVMVEHLGWRAAVVTGGAVALAMPIILGTRRGTVDDKSVVVAPGDPATASVRVPR